MDMFGIFNDEGLVEGDFYTKQEAIDFMAFHYDPEVDDLHVAKCCHDHPECEADYCEECLNEEE